MHYRSIGALCAALMLLVIVAFAPGPFPAAAAGDGVLDAAFDTDGIAIADFDNADYANAILIQNDKLLVAGYIFTEHEYDFALARFNDDGSLDLTFGTAGKTTTDFFGDIDHANALAFDTGGNVILAGLATQGALSDFALTRYTSNGVLDGAFGNAGKVVTDFGQFDSIEAVGAQNDGRIVVAGFASVEGEYNLALARYEAGGALDLTFGTDGKVLTDLGGAEYAYAMVIQSDGKIVIAGQVDLNGAFDFLLARYLPDGVLDTTFGTNGFVITDFGGDDYGTALALQDEGRLIVAGHSDDGNGSDFALARYTDNGILDASFGAGGLVTTDLGNNDYSYDLAIQIDGKLLVVGEVDNDSHTDFALARYMVDGQRDATFGLNGQVITDLGAEDTANSIAIQADGKAVVAGYSDLSGTDDFTLARYYARDGGPDLTPVSTHTPRATAIPTEETTPITTPTDVLTALPTDATTPDTTPTTPSVTPDSTLTLTPPATLISTPDGTGTPVGSPTPHADDVSTAVQPEAPATLVYTDETSCDATIDFPTGAVSEATTFIFSPLDAPNASLGSYHYAGFSFILEAYRNNVLLPHFVFAQPVRLTLQCSSEQMTGLDETQMQLVTYDTAISQWSADGIRILSRDPATQTLVVELMHLSEYALVAPIRTFGVYMPVIHGN